MSRMYSSTKQAFPNERFYAIECYTPRRRPPRWLITLACVGLIVMVVMVGGRA